MACAALAMAMTGWIALIGGLLVLAISLVRALKAGKHDPDLPPEYRV